MMPSASLLVGDARKTFLRSACLACIFFYNLSTRHRYSAPAKLFLRMEGDLALLKNVARRKDVIESGCVVRVCLLRHAEATHNDACRRLCPPKFRADVLSDPNFFDAPLTFKGKQQALDAANMIPPQLAADIQRLNDAASSEASSSSSPSSCQSRPAGVGGGANAEAGPVYVFTSPLRRCLHTLSLAVPTLETATLVDDLREWAGGHPCDGRHTLREQMEVGRALFSKGVNLRPTDPNEDPIQADGPRETPSEVTSRCVRFLMYLGIQIAKDVDKIVNTKTRDATVLACAHSGVFRQLLSALDVFNPVDRYVHNAAWKVFDLPLAPFLSWMADLAAADCVEDTNNGEDEEEGASTRASSSTTTTVETRPPSSSLPSSGLQKRSSSRLPVLLEVPRFFPLRIASQDGQRQKDKNYGGGGPIEFSFESFAELADVSTPATPFSFFLYPPIDEKLDGENVPKLREYVKRLQEEWTRKANESLLMSERGHDKTTSSFTPAVQRAGRLAEIRGSPLALRIMDYLHSERNQQLAAKGAESRDMLLAEVWAMQHAPTEWVTDATASGECVWSHANRDADDDDDNGGDLSEKSSGDEKISAAATRGRMEGPVMEAFDWTWKELITPNCLVVVTNWRTTNLRFVNDDDDDDDDGGAGPRLPRGLAHFCGALAKLEASYHIVEVQKLEA